MTTQTTTRCENLACLCDVSATQETCSEYCASLDGRDPQNVRCACGHPKCTEQVERQLHGEGGRESV
jgi:hypothetical protein